MWPSTTTNQNKLANDQMWEKTRSKETAKTHECFNLSVRKLFWNRDRKELSIDLSTRHMSKQLQTANSKFKSITYYMYVMGKNLMALKYKEIKILKKAYIKNFHWEI